MVALLPRQGGSWPVIANRPPCPLPSFGEALESARPVCGVGAACASLIIWGFARSIQSWTWRRSHCLPRTYGKYCIGGVIGEVISHSRGRLGDSFARPCR